MTHIDMRTFLCREDNFGHLIHDHKSGATAAIDAPDADAIEKELRKLAASSPTSSSPTIMATMWKAFCN